MTVKIENFELFGGIHWGIILFTVAVPLVLGWRVRKLAAGQYLRATAVIWAALIIASELFHFYWAVREMPSWSDLLARSLPLHLCGWSMVLTVIILLSYPRRRQWCFDLAYYWSLVGGFLAIIGPDLPADFPSVGFWQFFATHVLNVSACFFAIAGLNYRPSRRSLLRAFIYTNAVMIILIPVNLLLGANYFFICRPPETALPLFFWRWPWYIVFMEFFAAAIFTIMYLPFWISQRGAK